METNHTLEICKEFKSLIRPHPQKEFLELETSILNNGCLEPIKVWRGYIVDGHCRYDICTRYHIPFSVEEMPFDCKEAAVVWICATQCKRENITEEARHFLIGMQYETEKIINSNKRDDLLNPQEEDDFLPESEILTCRHITAQRLAKENNVSFGTIQKYARYTRAILEIGRKAPELVPKILSGRYKMSHNSILEIERMSPEEIQKLNKRLGNSRNQVILKFKKSRAVIQSNYTTSASGTQSSVKDMPSFDPDAAINSLTLTIPSWLDSIQRTKQNTNFNHVSKPALIKAQTILDELATAVTELLFLIEEV